MMYYYGRTDRGQKGVAMFWATQVARQLKEDL